MKNTLHVGSAVIILSFFYLATNAQSWDCGRGFDGIQTPFGFMDKHITVDNVIWSAGGFGEIALYKKEEESKFIKLPTSEDLKVIYFIDDYIGFVLGTKGTIFSTNDTGQTWTAQNSNTKNDLLAISCINKLNCWVVGRGGIVIVTTNGGYNWEVLGQNLKEDLNTVAFVSEEKGWAAGKNGIFLQTLDSGKTWKSVDNIKFDKEPIGLLGRWWQASKFFDEKFGCIAGDNRIMCTSNGGKSWKETAIGFHGFVNLVGFSFIEKHPAALDKCGKDIISKDRGGSWQLYKNDHAK